MSEKKLTQIHGHGDVRRLQTRNEIRAPIDTVWDCLTQIEHVRQWWADGQIGNAVGEPFQLGGDEQLNGSIKLMMQPHIFAFTWHDKPDNAAEPNWIEPLTQSLVHFDLIETAPDLTLLTLIQYAPISGATGAAAGWHHLFEMLTTYVQTGTATTTDDRFEVLKVFYQAD